MSVNKIDLFLCDAREPISEALLLKYLAALPYKEQIRLTKFSGVKWKNRLISLALLYSELAIKTGEKSKNLRISRNTNGKPYLEEFSQYKFNLSHSNDFIALAIARTNSIGLDIEKIDFSRRNLPRISARFFSSVENEALLKYKGKKYALMFYRLWTLKEAWVKANGEALIPNIRNIEFLIEESKFTINSIKNLQNGQFFLYRPLGNFILAFCSLDLNLKIKYSDFKVKTGLPLLPWKNVDRLGPDYKIRNLNL